MSITVRPKLFSELWFGLPDLRRTDDTNDASNSSAQRSAIKIRFFPAAAMGNSFHGAG